MGSSSLLLLEGRTLWLMFGSVGLPSILCRPPKVSGSKDSELHFLGFLLKSNIPSVFRTIWISHFTCKTKFLVYNSPFLSVWYKEALGPSKTLFPCWLCFNISLGLVASLEPLTVPFSHFKSSSNSKSTGCLGGTSCPICPVRIFLTLLDVDWLSTWSLPPWSSANFTSNLSNSLISSNFSCFSPLKVASSDFGLGLSFLPLLAFSTNPDSCLASCSTFS